MKKRFTREDLVLIALAILLLFSTFFIENKKTLVKDDYYEEKYRAAERMEAALEEVKSEKIRRGIEIDPSLDINETGIIGVEFNEITTTLGALESKRTSANPNFAAVLVDLLLEADLEEGDKVAMNLSSSFPALNIASIVACETLDLEPVIISSIGSSTWGGNNLDFTYLDMEDHLYKEGIIKHKSTAFSPGGAGDLGLDMDQEELEKIIARLKSSDRELILEEDLQENITKRMEIYYSHGEEINGFINIGGNILSFGNTEDSTRTPAGLIRDQDYKLSDKTGLVQEFYSRDIASIHLLNIKDLAHNYGLKVDPNTPFVLGEGDIYYNYDYPYGLILALVGFSLIILVFYRKKTKKDYD